MAVANTLAYYGAAVIAVVKSIIVQAQTPFVVPRNNQQSLELNHRYQKKKIDCLRFVMCPLLAPALPRLFLYGH
jgi:hypothetical protein